MDERTSSGSICLRNSTHTGRLAEAGRRHSLRRHMLRVSALLSAHKVGAAGLGALVGWLAGVGGVLGMAGAGSGVAATGTGAGGGLRTGAGLGAV